MIIKQASRIKTVLESDNTTEPVVLIQTPSHSDNYNPRVEF